MFLFYLEFLLFILKILNKDSRTGQWKPQSRQGTVGVCAVGLQLYWSKRQSPIVVLFSPSPICLKIKNMFFDIYFFYSLCIFPSLVVLQVGLRRAYRAVARAEIQRWQGRLGRLTVKTQTWCVSSRVELWTENRCVNQPASPRIPADLPRVLGDLGQMAFSEPQFANL